jgi:hypothetical protein
MSNDVPIGRTLGIRECGYDEYWLQDQIYANPACLGLGKNVEAFSREHRQSSGGRLDILLNDPQENSMYEVEVMLGPTNESHIIRTIEYWDNEKRRWPLRSHFAVIVAESITRRFFNVIRLLSQTVPIIAVQVNIVEADGHKILHYTKVLDIFEEPEEPEVPSNEIIDEQYWRTKAPWTLDTASTLREVLAPAYGSPMSLKYVKQYIALTVNEYNKFSLERRSANKSLLSFRVEDDSAEKAAALLDTKGIPYFQRSKRLWVTIDHQLVKSNEEIFRKLAEIEKAYIER